MHQDMQVPGGQKYVPGGFSLLQEVDNKGFRQAHQQAIGGLSIILFQSRGFVAVTSPVSSDLPVCTFNMPAWTMKRALPMSPFLGLEAKWPSQGKLHITGAPTWKLLHHWEPFNLSMRFKAKIMTRCFFQNDLESSCHVRKQLKGSTIQLFFAGSQPFQVLGGGSACKNDGTVHPAQDGQGNKFWNQKRSKEKNENWNPILRCLRIFLGKTWAKLKQAPHHFPFEKFWVSLVKPHKQTNKVPKSRSLGAPELTSNRRSVISRKCYQQCCFQDIKRETSWPPLLNAICGDISCC